jgi:hypothetical protein
MGAEELGSLAAAHRGHPMARMVTRTLERAEAIVG